MYDDDLRKIRERFDLPEDVGIIHPALTKLREKAQRLKSEVDADPLAAMNSRRFGIYRGVAEIGLAALVTGIAVVATGVMGEYELTSTIEQTPLREYSQWLLFPLAAVSMAKGIYDVVKNTSELREIALHYVRRK